ncbi:MAG: hypothetical protein Q9193_004573 [Seirophora villosa]
MAKRLVHARELFPVFALLAGESHPRAQAAGNQQLHSAFRTGCRSRQPRSPVRMGSPRVASRVPQPLGRSPVPRVCRRAKKGTGEDAAGSDPGTGRSKAVTAPLGPRRHDLLLPPSPATHRRENSDGLVIHRPLLEPGSVLFVRHSPLLGPLPSHPLPTVSHIATQNILPGDLDQSNVATAFFTSPPFHHPTGSRLRRPPSLLLSCPVPGGGSLEGKADHVEGDQNRRADDYGNGQIDGGTTKGFLDEDSLGENLGGIVDGWLSGRSSCTGHAVMDKKLDHAATVPQHVVRPGRQSR